MKKWYLLNFAILFSPLTALANQSLESQIQPKSEAQATIAPSDKTSADLLEIAHKNSGGWLVQSLKSRPKTLTPYLAITSEGLRVKKYIFESLMKESHDLTHWNAWIAKRWKVSDDGLSYTFELNRQVTFSDGEPLDSSDVVFTYNFLMNEKIATPGPRTHLKKLESVTANGPYEVTFKYKKPYFQALRMVAGLHILPEHYYKKFLDAPDVFNNSRALILGSGPYQWDNSIGDKLSGSSISLKKNIRYWGDNKGTFDKLVWKFIDNNNARLVAFRNGDIDSYEVEPKLFESLKQEKDIAEHANDYEYMRPTQGYTYIAWNPVHNGKATLFADKRVRMAMTYLTDRNKIVDQVYGGFAETTASPFREGGKQHDPEISSHEYSVTKAKALLSDLGFKDRDNDGVIENEAGTPFSFKFTYATEREDSRLVALLLRDAYARAGIHMVLDPQLSSVLYDMMDKKSYQALTSGWSGGQEVDIYYMFHSDQINDSQYNFISYRNNQLDSLINQTRTTTDDAARMALWRQAERILHDEQPYTFLIRRKSLMFVNKRLKNVKVTQSGLNLNLLPMEVYIPKALQKH